MSAPPPAPKSDPWRKETAWNYSGCFVYLLFLCAYLFYYYVRIRYTLHGGLLAYAVVILIFEFISSSSMVVHGLSLLRRRYETLAKHACMCSRGHEAIKISRPGAWRVSGSAISPALLHYC